MSEPLYLRPNAVPSGRSTQARFFYGWAVVATAAVGLLLGAAPIVVFSFGVFFKSFSQEFHASRAAISLAFTVHNFVAALVVPLIGRLVDRCGARRVILPGLAILGLILLSAQWMGSKIWQLYVFYAALGVASMATTPVPYGIIVSRWFNHRRGIALGLMMAGLGAGAIVMPPVAQRLIASFGWRGAFAVVGCMVLLIPMPIVGRFFKEDPRQMGVLPDGARKAATATSAPGHLEGLTWHEIWHTRAFWLMLTAFFLLATTVHACVIHMPELLHDRGVSATSAALASSIFGLALMVGRVGSGYLLDLYFAPCVALFVFLQAALGIVLLGSGAAGPIALIGAFSVGLAMGAEVDMIAYLMSRYFGLRALGTAFGFGFGAFVLAGGLGPLLMGVGFDRTGSYRIPLAGFFAAAIVAAALVSRLGPYRYAAISTDEDEDHPRAAA